MQAIIDKYQCNPENKIIEKIRSDAHENNQYAVFLLDQVSNYSKKRPQWSELTVRFCLMWRFSSPKGYDYPSSFIKLPSRATLQRYAGRSGEDMPHIIKNRLLADAQLLSPTAKVCSILIDDMAIKPKLNYNKAEDKFYGIETINEETSITKGAIANKMLCFVLRGLSIKYTIPVAYYFHKQITHRDMYELTLQVLQLLHECGFVTIRLVADNHKSNVALFTMLGNGNLTTQIDHPIEPKIPLFLSFDYCHVAKNARNIFLDRDMSSDQGIITSQLLVSLYNIQKDMVIKPVRFLTRKHLYPSNFEKMNVRRAVELFSPPVTAAIKYLAVQDGVWNYNFTTSVATVEYMEMMYKFFQIHDVSDRIQYVRQRNEDCAPYISVDDERLSWMRYTFPQYVDSIQRNSAENHVPGLTKETAHALKFTCKSTAECIQYLLRDVHFYFVLTRAFSSDAIESTFSQIRMRGGSQDATDARDANVSADCTYISNVEQSKIAKEQVQKDK